MQANQRITEITGKPGQVWGNVIVPSTGTITIKVVGDTLQASVQSGLETKNSWTRIQNVDCIDLTEVPNYAILIFGSLLALIGLGGFISSSANGSSPFLAFVFLVGGIACVVLAIRKKRRLLAIHSLRNTIPVFMTKPTDTYQHFAMNVIAIARQLNTLAIPQPKPINTQTGQTFPSQKKQ